MLVPAYVGKLANYGTRLHAIVTKFVNKARAGYAIGIHWLVLYTLCTVDLLASHFTRILLLPLGASFTTIPMYPRLFALCFE